MTSNSQSGAPTVKTLRVVEARSRDVGRNIARLDAEDLNALGLSPGQPLEVRGRRRTVALVMPSVDPDSSPGTIQIDGITRGNADADLDERVTVQLLNCVAASHVKLTSPSGALSATAQGIEKYLGKLLKGIPILEGDLVRVSLFGVSTQDFRIIACEPAAPGVIEPMTQFELVVADTSSVVEQRLVYEDIGGLGQEVQRLRGMVEIPLRHPRVFERLGVSAPRAVLLTGPPGVGKSLMARVVAEAAQAHFFATSGSEILNKYYRQAETHLQDIFRQAMSSRPAVIFIDELEHITSQKCFAAGNSEKQIAMELLALIDQLERNGRVVVIGSSTRQEDVHPTFRRHGRFEREINVRTPKHKDRLDILEIHSRGIPVSGDVDFDQLAALTQGFVGADLSILCQEAALIALRQKMIETGQWGEPTFEVLAGIEVTMVHFLEALRAINPSMPEAASVEFVEVSWDDIGGLHNIREQLMDAVIMPLRAPELFTRVRARPVPGVLLHGPPGTGKTTLARALAREPDISFFPAKCPDVLSAGAAAQTIRDLFRRAKQMSPSIIFLDEIEVMSWQRQPGGGITDAERALRQLVSEIDGMEQLRGVVVLGATNRLDLVEPELFRPGRFDLLLEIPLPNHQALREVLGIHLRDRPLAADVDLTILVKLAGGFSGADIKVVCQMAAANAIREHLSEKGAPDAELLICQRHLAAAIAEICMQKLEEK